MIISTHRPLPDEIRDAQHELEQRARDYGLDFFETIFEVVDYEEMSMLAEIWHDRGETSAAKELLIDCLRKLVAEIRESNYPSDREMFAEEFKHHRTTYLRLFSEGESELEAQNIPVDPL